MRHAPDLFVRKRDGSVLVVDVKPQERMTDADRIQHDRTRSVCSQLGWQYEEFTYIDVAVDRNTRFLGGYSHQRFAPSPSIRAALTGQVVASGAGGIRLDELTDVVSARESTDAADVICAVYNMIWCGELHVELQTPLAWKTVV